MDSVVNKEQPVKISNPPASSALMATARSFGNYDLAAALADLIDNSIKAKSSSVSVDFYPSDEDVIVRIRDDGEGMDRSVLIDAMRPASSHPEAEREADDLGRFGWGMKSASLSQARVLTVVSWKDGQIHAARWDIDDIEDWSMDVFDNEEAESLLGHPADTSSGTEVIWTSTDRLCESGAQLSLDDSLTHGIAHARQKLSLIFHRYLSGEAGRKFGISMNGSRLEAVDPFLVSHPATQTLDPEVITMSKGAVIAVQPYVLPHFSKLTIEEQERLGGPEGMVRNQGFYVYRNKRLIIYGTWFRLVPHGEYSQLTRVRVELPNTADNDWRITVDKSDAQLPSELKKRLREVVKRFNRKSTAVHRKKGVSLEAPGRQPVWNRTIKNGHVRYLINRDHPMVVDLLAADGVGDESGNAASVLKLIESYFPTDHFISDGNKEDSKLSQSLSSSEEFEGILLQCVINYARGCDGQPDIEGFLNYLKGIEPFASQWRYTETYVRENAARQWGMIDGL